MAGKKKVKSESKLKHALLLQRANAEQKHSELAVGCRTRAESNAIGTIHKRYIYLLFLEMTWWFGRHLLSYLLQHKLSHSRSLFFFSSLYFSNFAVLSR